MQGKQVELEITGVAHGGIFIARYDGRVVFVSDAIPGETVIAEISNDSKKLFWRADTVGVVTRSDHRRAHPWAEASLAEKPENRAGGAEFGHIELSHQRELKRQVIEDSLSRMAKIQQSVTVGALPSGQSLIPIPDVDGTGWRTRNRLHVAEDGTAGPFAARSHRVISVTALPLATPEAQKLAPLNKKFVGADAIDVIAPSASAPYLLVHEKEGTNRPKVEVITEKVGEREFRLDARGFWQVHRHGAQALTTAVQEAIDESHFELAAANLDLYGGVGLLAAAVGDRFGPGLKITSVESDSIATDHAAANLVDWAGAASVTARVDRYLRQLKTTAGKAERSRLSAATVVLDPPRSGAGAEVVAELGALAPAQIVYVACDPVALARDVALLAGHGYELVRLRAFDLFPNTHHVETIATLVRA